jgi:propionyl-CoA synthetase
MLACARLGAIHSVVFGGFARTSSAAHRRRPAQAGPHRLVRHRAQPRRRLQALPRRAIDLAEHKPDACRRAAARRRSPRLMQDGPRRRLGSSLGRARSPRRLRRGRRHRPALHPLHLGHHRQAQGHRPRQRWPRGRAALVDAQHLRRAARARRCSPPPTSAGSSATPTSSTARCSPARPRCVYEGKPVGTPDAGAFWRMISEYGVRALFTAPTAIRAIKKEDPGAASCWPTTTCQPCATLFLAGERSTPTPTNGRARSWACQSSTTGGRPRPAGRSRRTARPRGNADQAGLAERARAGLRRADPRRARPTGRCRHRGCDLSVKLPMPPGTLPTLWGDDERYVSSYLSAFRLLPHRRRRLRRR